MGIVCKGWGHLLGLLGSNTAGGEVRLIDNFIQAISLRGGDCCVEIAFIY